MTTRTQPTNARRWVLVFLAALVAVLATILSSASASAATTGTAETRVRASSVVAEVPVGPPQRICAGQRLGEEPSRVVGVVATGVAAKTESSLARTCLRSFAGTTLVLMADGSKKAIEDIKVGDKVVATDPETGERMIRKVTHVWVHDDQLTDLVVDGQVITTTEDHLFWSVTDQRFERADELASGEVVLGDGGRGITVSGLRHGTEHTALAFNLSIAGVHTYHVGDDAILVHNDCYDALRALNDPKALEGLTASQVDDLARNAGYIVKPGGSSYANPATKYFVPGTRESVGFRVLPNGVPGEPGIKGGPYLKFAGGKLAGTYVRLR